MRQVVVAITILMMLVTTAISANTPDDLFDSVLRDHVKNGFVDYPSINEDQRFDQYLKYIAMTDPDSFASQEEKLAFWINAYNALAIKGILDGLSPDGFFARISFFKTTDYALARKEINLYDLERDIIIPFGEPRIHFAIVCASMSCPLLKSEVYRAQTLDAQLEDSAKQFINDSNKNVFNSKLGIANISMIFDWFTEDFEKHSGSVASYLRQYTQNADDSEVLAAEDVYIRHMDYDWSLNGKSLN